jgi:hypothetical protein
VLTGCDSIVTLNLIVNPILYTSFTDSICDGQTYTWNNQTYTTAGPHTQTLTSVLTGCDSIVTLNLIVNPILYTSFTDSICDGDTYTWNGTPYTTAGLHTQTLTSILSGCDSIVTLNLIVHPAVYTTTLMTLCNNQLPITWNGQTISTGGIYTATLTSVLTGCDSIATLDLHVDSVVTSFHTDSICDGQTYSWNNLTLTTAGVYPVTLTSQVSGCDSIATLTLIVHPAQYSSFTDSICDGQTYTWNNVAYTTAGPHTQTLTSVLTGCDSIVTLNLIVNPILYTSFTDSICDGETYTWNNVDLHHCRAHTQTLTSVLTGCDSIVTLNLIVNPILYTSFTDSICDGDTYTWNNVAYTTAGPHTQTLTSILTGCDSIVTLNLIVHPTVYSSTPMTLCNNQLPITWNGQTITTGGIYTATLTSVLTGCDSIATLDLHVDSVVTSFHTDSICDGQTYSWNNLNLTTAGIYPVTLTSQVSGCDSIATLTLIVHPAQYSSFTDSICDGDTYTWNNVAYTTAGPHTQTLTSVLTGCDSIVTLNLIVHPTQYSSFTDSICDGQTYTWNNQTYTTAGPHTQTLTSVLTGCDSIVTLNLIVNPILYTSFTDSICDGDTYTWNVHALHYRWAAYPDPHQHAERLRLHRHPEPHRPSGGLHHDADDPLQQPAAHHLEHADHYHRWYLHRHPHQRADRLRLHCNARSACRLRGHLLPHRLHLRRPDVLLEQPHPHNSR